MKLIPCTWLLACFLFLNPFPLKAAKEKYWIEIRSPHFTVVSDAGEKKARRVAHEFEQFHAVIRQFIPNIQAGPSVPTVVLAAKDEGSLRSLLPQFWEKKGSVHPSGMFVSGLEKNYVALRLDMDDDFRYHVVYHEYVHLLMRLNYPPLPTWLSEGLAECFGYAIISDESSEVGHPSPMQLYILRDEQPLSIQDLFAVDHESPHYREESKASIFYAQSWALTHMLLLGNKTEHAPKLWKLLELIQKNVPADKAIAQVFGDLKELENQFEEYILQLGFYAFKVKTPSVKDPEMYSVRMVPRLESLALQGDFYVSTGRWAEAKNTLDSVLAEDPDNAEALTSMGVYYQNRDQEDEARKYFVAASNSGSKSCATHYYAGLAAMQSGEYESAETSFRQAAELNSGFAPAYAALAHILAMKEETVEEALMPAMQAVEIEPGVLSHQLNLANVLMRSKKVDAAIQYAERVEEAAESDRDRQEAGRFLSQARRYRDELRAMEQMVSGVVRQPQEGSAQSSETQSGPDETESDRLEDIRKALEEDKANRDRLLREREEAFDRRESTERQYLEEVYAARAKGTAHLEGFVANVRCLDPAVMEISIETDGNTNKFHVANYFDVEFRAVDYKPEGELNPCTDLIGRRLTIEYIATPGAAYAGEIRSLSMYKK